MRGKRIIASVTSITLDNRCPQRCTCGVCACLGDCCANVTFATDIPNTEYAACCIRVAASASITCTINFQKTPSAAIVPSTMPACATSVNVELSSDSSAQSQKRLRQGIAFCTNSDNNGCAFITLKVNPVPFDAAER